MNHPQTINPAEGPPLDPGQATLDIAETIRSGRSERGGWNKPQLAMIGVAWPPLRGWRKALEASGIRVTRELHDRFVALRGCGKGVPSKATEHPTPVKAA